MPHVSILVHCVWSTKNRIPYLNTNDLRKKVWTHIMDYGIRNNISIDCVGGYQEHCHCLFSLGLERPVCKIIQLIKGESSHWINKNRLCNTRFEWQDDYFAASVSISELSTVRRYINTQEEHHKTISFKDEFVKWTETGEAFE